MKDQIQKKKLIVPGGIWLLGLIMCAVCAPLTTYVNGGVGLGLLLMIIGSILFIIALYREYNRIGLPTPMLLDRVFPSYPIAEDKDETGKLLSGFRSALGEFLEDKRLKENSSLQDYASQLLWHSFALWKQRMKRFGVTLRFTSSRRSYTKSKTAIRSEEYFDGRYDVKDVCEEIFAEREFSYEGRVLERIEDKEVAHYTLLSAHQVGNDRVICPNCGNSASRSNLIDGCDYCGTKFTVEDMENSVGSFGFRRDFAVSESKKDAVAELILPWVFLITLMPFIYFGFFGAFLYGEGIPFFGKIITGIVAAGLLGLLGWCMVKFNMIILVPIVMGYSRSGSKINRKLLYRSQEEQKQEKEAAEFIRKRDPHFSIQSFFGGLTDKLTAIHYADRKEQINAFSDCDLSANLKEYSNVIDVDPISIRLSSYEIKDKMQLATVDAELVLREFRNKKIRTRTEVIKLQLAKSADCRTQAVCGPSILKCDGCGSSLSLMEGKTCAYCGRDLDLKKYDWVIENYSKA